MNRDRGLFRIIIVAVLLFLAFLQIKNLKNIARLQSEASNIAKEIKNISLNSEHKIVNENAQESNYIIPQGRTDSGDWLVWAMRTEPKTLNPVSVDKDIYQKWMTVPDVFEPLLNYDFDSSRLEPVLAESYEISEDGKQYTFKLRDDVYFSDGVPVTADDVIFTYQAIIDPKVDAANIAYLYQEVVNVEKLDARTVRFTVNKVHFKMLEILCFWETGVLPKHIYGYDDANDFNNYISNPVGSGPYVFEKWEQGRSISLVRNENYWGKKPALKKRVYQFVQNEVASVQAVKAGQVDMIMPTPEQYAALTSNSEFVKKYNCQAYWNPSTPFYYIAWNMRKEPFDDKLVRRAMTHMLNRQAVIDALMGGNGELISGPFYCKGIQYDQSIEPLEYSPAIAGELLDEAGWKDTDGDGYRDKNGKPLSFHFLYSANSLLYDGLAKVLKDAGAQIGIEIIADPLEWSILIGRINDRDFDSMAIGWGGDVEMDPYQGWHSSQAAGRGSNYWGYQNPEADRLIELGQQTLDYDERSAIFRKIHALINEAQPQTFLYARPEFRIIDKRFENVKSHTLGLNYNEWYVPRENQKYR